MAEVLAPQEPRSDGKHRRRFFIARPVAPSRGWLPAAAALEARKYFGPDVELELETVAEAPLDSCEHQCEFSGRGWTGRYIVYELVPNYVTEEVP